MMMHGQSQSEPPHGQHRPSLKPDTGACWSGLEVVRAALNGNSAGHTMARANNVENATQSGIDEGANRCAFGEIEARVRNRQQVVESRWSLGGRRGGEVRQTAPVEPSLLPGVGRTIVRMRFYTSGRRGG
jgi:hypothetical protein